jgi:hypothetical protein
MTPLAPVVWQLQGLRVEPPQSCDGNLHDKEPQGTTKLLVW